MEQDEPLTEKEMRKLMRLLTRLNKPKKKEPALSKKEMRKLNHLLASYRRLETSLVAGKYGVAPIKSLHPKAIIGSLDNVFPFLIHGREKAQDLRQGHFKGAFHAIEVSHPNLVTVMIDSLKRTNYEGLARMLALSLNIDRRGQREKTVEALKGALAKSEGWNKESKAAVQAGLFHYHNNHKKIKVRDLPADKSEVTISEEAEMTGVKVEASLVVGDKKNTRTH